MRFLAVIWALSGGLLQPGASFHGLKSSKVGYPSAFSKCSNKGKLIMCAPEGMQVALTREAGKNSKLATLLREVGITSIEVPCIAHKDGPDFTLLPIALKTEELAYVTITSPEAAKVFLDGWNVAGKPRISVACVGKATGEVLKEGGITPVFTPSKATAETLAAELPLPSSSLSAAENEAQQNNAKRLHILYPASVKAQKTLEEGLEARGFDVRRLDTYDTVAAEWTAEQETAAAKVPVVAFGSPSAVKTWAARLGVYDGRGNGGALAACIGETSAKACRGAGWSETAIFYPEKPGMEGWAQAVSRALVAMEATRGGQAEGATADHH